MLIVRQSTARTVIVGPVLDSSGAAVTTAVVGDLKISKNGGAPAALNASATLTHRHTGHYSLALTASDCDTVGQAEVVIDSTTNAMPVKELSVLSGSVYDVMFGTTAISTYAGADTSGTTTLLSRIGSALTITSGRVNADVTHFGGSAGTFAAGIPAVNSTQFGGATVTATTSVTFPAASTVATTTGAVGSVTGAVGSVTGNVGGNVAGSVGSVTGNVGGNVVGSVGSVTARVTANTDQLAGQTVTAAAGVTFPSSVASPTNITAGTITTVSGNVAGSVGSVTGNVGGSVGSVAAAGITAASIATGAITSAKFAAGAIDSAAIAADAIGSAQIAASAVTEIQSGLATASALSTVAGYLDTEIAAILADTDALETRLTATRAGYLDNLDAAVSTRLAAAAYTAPLSAGGTADAVWNAATASYGSAGTYGLLVESNLDAAVSSRMATYTQPAGFLAATFPSTVASPTNITAGTLTTVTNLTNLPSIPANWITAAGIAADAGAEIAGAVWDEALEIGRAHV